MTTTMIRVDAEISADLASAFPDLRVRIHRRQSTITGDIIDQQQLLGALNLLDTLDITIIEVVTIPDEPITD